ncbi:hypothetical protein FRB99_008199 [Tulasnella sp. 403]|nr:hypothetical protein FRB99_008199 [Tulasnella sp. 403]
MFQGGADHLDSLNLQGVSVPWTSPLLSHLRILDMHEIYGLGAPTTHQLLTVLMQCPHLSELNIHDCHILESDISRDLPTRLDLPHLRLLVLVDIYPPSSAFSILSRISSPRYELFRLDSSFYTQEHLLVNDVFRNISHITPSLVHLVASAKEVQIFLEDHFCHFLSHPESSGRQLPSLDLLVFGHSPLTVLEWLSKGFGGAMSNIPVVGVELARYSSGEGDPAVAAAIGSFPSTTNMKLCGDYTSIIRYLSTPAVIDGTQHWPLPELSKLTIKSGRYDPNLILEMVQSRYGTTDVDSTRQLPSRLKSLVLYGRNEPWDQHILGRIRDIMGKDHFRFR